MPMGKYENFKACRKEHTDAYCGALYWKTDGKKKGTEKIKKEIQELREILNDKY